MSLSLHIPDNIKRVSRMLGYSLMLGTADAWLDFAAVVAARLTDRERAGLAFAALRSLSDEQAAAVAGAVLPDGTSAPIPPLFGYLDEAAFWADMAEPEAVEAYCAACFDRMAPARRADFLDHVQRGQAA